ncbi:MAG: serine/threonine protein kinase [Magnetococcales bacterium]|nr:serine/threonine protein kinase [Magnetococcales bacterium]
MAEDKTPYRNLGPEAILDAVESIGYRCDGSLLALNSFENRVYQVGIEEGDGLVAKFYRANRWSNEAILEEHHFSQELADLEIPVIPPLALDDGATLHAHATFRFALYPRRGGRAPDLENSDHLKQLGRFLGRIHAAGAVTEFAERPTLDIASFGEASMVFLLESGFIPLELETPYRTLAEDLLSRIRASFDAAGSVNLIRLHGDCHPGNILWTDAGPHFVDFDDARRGPAIQDLWMCLSGERADRTAQLGDLLEGYGQFYDFDPRELLLIEALRTLRMMHYAAWIARRWEDPAFPRAFPWFNNGRYWDEHILSLREQASMMEERPLEWMG